MPSRMLRWHNISVFFGIIFDIHSWMSHCKMSGKSYYLSFQLFQVDFL